MAKGRRSGNKQIYNTLAGGKRRLTAAWRLALCGGTGEQAWRAANGGRCAGGIKTQQRTRAQTARQHALANSNAEVGAANQCWRTLHGARR